MSPPKHAYCESEVDETLPGRKSGLGDDSSSSTVRQKYATKKGATSTNSDSGQSSKTHTTSRSTASRNSTSKTSTSSRNPSADGISKVAKSSPNAERRRPAGSSAAAESTSPTVSSKGAKKLATAVPITGDPLNTTHTMVGSARPPGAVDAPGGFFIPDIRPATSPTATFAPSSYHGPPGAPMPRPRAGSSGRSRPASVGYSTVEGTWIPPPETPSSQRPLPLHTYSTPQVPSQQPSMATSGTWVQDSTAIPGAYPATAQPRPRPVLQQPGAQHDGRRASMYGAPIVQHFQASYYQPGYPPLANSVDPARAAIPPPPSLPIRTSSTRQQQHQSAAASSYGSSYGNTSYLTPGFDPNQTVRPPRTSSMQQRATVLPPQPKAKSTSYHTKTGGLSTSTTIGTRAATDKPSSSRKAQDKLDKRTQSAKEYQDRMDTRASKTSEELLNEALEDRRRTKKERHHAASEPTPKSRSANPSQSRQSRAGSSISRTGTDTERSMQITLDGNNIGISGETGDRSIEIRTGEDGTPQITVGSPTKRRETSYHGGGSSQSRLSFADRAKRRDGALSDVDGRDDD